MKLKNPALLLIALAFYSGFAFTQDLQKPIVDYDVVFQETNGMVAVEAEYFFKQSKSEIRQWYITSRDKTANVGRQNGHSSLQGKNRQSRKVLCMGSRLQRRIYLDIEEAGIQEITFIPKGIGPDIKLASGTLPKPFPVVTENPPAKKSTTSTTYSASDGTFDVMFPARKLIFHSWHFLFYRSNSTIT